MKHQGAARNRPARESSASVVDRRVGAVNNAHLLLLLGEIKGRLDSVVQGQSAENERLALIENRLAQVDVIANEIAAVKSHQAEHTAKLSGLDSRLRTVEVRSGVYGAVGGGAVALGVALIVERLRAWGASAR